MNYLVRDWYPLPFIIITIVDNVVVVVVRGLLRRWMGVRDGGRSLHLYVSRKIMKMRMMMVVVEVKKEEGEDTEERIRTTTMRI
jgi:hypothetical protein